MTTKAQAGLDGVALDAWRGFLLSHKAIVRELDADLVARHGLTSRDYEVLLFLSQAPERQLKMSELAERTMLTRSGVTRLIDGLQQGGLVERVSCPSDARVSWACLTDTGYAKLREAGRTHVESVRAAFLQYFSNEELEQLAEMLGRLPSVGGGSCTVD
jgi:DNA-binding MarR family transcriptional regulator